MTTAKARSRTRQETTTVGLDLVEAPPVSFGQAGMLSPLTATVTRTVFQDRELVTVRLRAENRNGIGFDGTWGYPTAGRLHAMDYGYGGAGYLSDLPAELRQALFDETGFSMLVADHG